MSDFQVLRSIVGSLCIVLALVLIYAALSGIVLNGNFGAWNHVTLIISAGLSAIAGLWNILKNICWDYDPVLFVGILPSVLNALLALVMFIISIFVGGIGIGIIFATVISIFLNYISGYLLFANF